MFHVQSLSRALKVSITSLACMLSGLVLIAAPNPAQADTAPTDGLPPTVSADGLPTWQINGVVWSQVVVGNTVYVTGSFTKARPPGVAAGGAGEVAANNIFAYNITTGARVTTFNHQLNGQGLTITASPDGSRVYVGGDFTTVDGIVRNHIAAFDTATGALNTAFKPSIPAQVAALAVSPTTVYAGGNFSTAGGQARKRLAAFAPATGALLSWAPTADDQKVTAMVMSPDNSRVIVGGRFSTLSGTPAVGMGSLDASTGAVMPWAINQLVRDGGGDACGITHLSADGAQVYGAGFAFGCGNFEGTFAADPNTGAVNWVNDCHGDTYGTFPAGQVLYSVSHAHDCSYVGDFPNSDPWSINMRHALASTTYPTRTNVGPDNYGWDYNGVPASQLLQWFPVVTPGSYTGQSQSAWSVSGNSNYVVLGGEFPNVNGAAQQGLVRFAVRSLAPNKKGPVKASNAPAPSAMSLSSGTARVAWQSAYDMDNKSLTYNVYRSGTAAAVYTKTLDSTYWNYPMVGFVDQGLTPGASYTYTIKVTDPLGNLLTIGTTNSVTISTATQSAYAQDVQADGASNYWRLGEPTGTAVYDYAGFLDATAEAGVTRGSAGAIISDPDKASTFGGGSTGSVGTNSTQAATPSFTIEAWVKTNSNSGGKIVGYGNAKTGTSSSYDRHIYMDNAGHVIFGIYNNATRTITTPGRYNDNAWHHIAASMDSTKGMTLYVDGKKIGSDASTTVAQPYTGYWRIGGDNLNGWPNQPSSNFLAGVIDDVALYPSTLPLARIQQHYIDSGRTLVIAPAPADTYGKAVYNSSPDLYWRLGEANGTTAQDASGNDFTGIYSGGVTLGQPGGVAGTSNTAARFDGVNDTIGSLGPVSGPSVYSEELWFKTTTTAGGKLIGFGDQQSGLSGNYDRHVYMEATGQLTFGTWTGFANTTTSPLSYNNGAWHHVVATQSQNGMRLYVDGALVGTNGQTEAQPYNGYWRVGGDSPWNGLAYFNGTIDEVAIYSTELSASQVASHYVAGGGAAPNQAPEAKFTTSVNRMAVSVDGTSSSDPDGTIASYDWDWGDGKPHGSGVTANHTYDTPGPYTITLTVTDDDGATAAVTHDIETSQNQAPTARFTSSTNGLTASFDAAGSSDGDGTIASYAWDFGDGTPAGSGVSPNHTYDTGKTYTVTLTVTDNEGGTGSVQHDVIVTNAPTLVASDAFARTLTGSWGNADQGGSWKLAGTASAFSVANGAGRITMSTAGTGPSTSLTGVSTTDADVRVTISATKVATGSGTFVSVFGRQVASVGTYRASVNIKSTGAVTVSLLRADGAGQTTIGTPVTVAGLTYAAGDKLRVRFEVTGTSPTTLKAKVWRQGDPEPASWLVSGSDSSGPMQVAGSVGLMSYLAANATNAPVSVDFDDLEVYLASTTPDAG